MPVDKLSVKVENERLFGPSVDLFKNYHASLSICNILKNIGVATSNDSDWFRAVAEFISVAELSAVYDKILPREQRETIAKSRYRTPPELQDDDPDDVLRYLATNIVHRKKLWCLLAKIYEKRVEEYKKLLENPDRNRSAVEKRFSEFQELFDLSELEIRILTVIFLSATRFVELGDFDVTRFRSSEKVTAIARAVGVPDIAVASLLEEQNNITKFGLVDCDLDIDRTFLSYLCGISSTPLADRFWTKYPEDAEVLPWEFFGRLTEKNGAVLKKMIEAKNPDKGLGCLLYGIPGSGKSSFAVSLAAATGKTLYFIAQNVTSYLIGSYVLSPKDLLIPAALLLAHYELQLTTGDNLLVCNVVTLELLAVKLHALHIALLRCVALAHNAEDATLDINLSLVDHRHAQHILARCWLYGVEAEGCHDIPCRHLAHILVAREAVYLC